MNGAAHAITIEGEDRMDHARVIGWLRRRGPALLLDIGVNFAAPLLIYDRTQGHMSDVNALLLSSAPPVVWGISGFVRSRRVDALSVIAIVGIALSVIAFFGGGSAQFLQLREKMVTLLIALAFLGSAAIGKPLIYPLARATMARESATILAEFDAIGNNPLVRRTMMVMTLVWGFGLLADFLVSTVLIYALSVEQYLVVGPILGHATMGGLALWTILYRRHRTRYGKAVRAKAAAEHREG